MTLRLIAPGKLLPLLGDFEMEVRNYFPSNYRT